MDLLFLLKVNELFVLYPEYNPPFLAQQSATFLAPGTAFVEDNFSTDQVGHDFEMIHIIFIVHFISNPLLPLI